MDVLMPQLGETVAEGTVAAWHKKEGDAVAADEIICDIETDKVSMEIPAPKAGTLARILVPSGETVEVGTVLGVIQGEGEELAEPEATANPAPAAASQPAEAPATPAAAPQAEDLTVTREAPSLDAILAQNDNRRLSPAVRRLIAEHNLDVNAIEGTGRNGRVTRRNVMDFIASGGATQIHPALKPEDLASGMPTQRMRAPDRAPDRLPPQTPNRAAAAPTPESGRIPFNRIRKLTADHMVQSKATSPHVLQAVEVDYSGVDRVRKAVKDSWKAQRGYSLTYLPFIAHAVCSALQEFPNANASVGNDELVLHSEVNLAIAVDLGATGLVAPVIHGAGRMTLTQLAEGIHDLAARARSNRLKPDDLSGGTYTLSNSGTFGTLITAPVINQPQVAILSTDGVRKKPVVVEHPDGDSIAIRPVGILAQSFDHRAIDGAYSAAYLDRVRKLLELTDWFREL